MIGDPYCTRTCELIGGVWTTTSQESSPHVRASARTQPEGYQGQGKANRGSKPTPHPRARGAIAWGG